MKCTAFNAVRMILNLGIKNQVITNLNQTPLVNFSQQLFG